ncbi:ATP-binding protein [Desulfurispira natronophila]|uniref:DNA repair exonuclease SbcCD ATPase subunit n=1 Tax=Desulfurispira natronophila TaxID=682562 RepID=A0A7W7Y4I0_9BACT|nr:hypothetical protein [Desulfurispira natronophila]MBB5021940.1 DNA repair exonuclease SbcCD ATPase subunit [Desulfurispira natronophila]
MKLVKLHIDTLPGIESGLSIDAIGLGTNLITGPNAIGKSSLIRSLRYLIGEPQSADPAALSLNAEFVDGDNRFVVRRLGRDITWQCNGEPTSRPSLPRPEQLHCYWLSMEDLLGAHSGDSYLLAELRRSMSGGCDLPALRSDPRFLVGSRVGYSEARNLREAQKQVQQIESSYEELRRNESRVPQLQEEIARCRQARKEQQQLERALQWLYCREQWQRVQSELAALPPHMERLRGDEWRRLESLRNKRRELHQQRGQAHGRVEHSRQQLLQTGLEQHQPSRTDLASRQREVQQLQHLMDQRREVNQQCDRLQAQRQAAVEALGGSGENPPCLSPHDVQRAQDLAGKHQQALHHCQQLEPLLAATPEPDPQEQQRCNQAANILRQWLASLTLPRTLPPAALVAAGGGLLAAVASLWFSLWIALVPAAVGTLGAMWAWWQVQQFHREQRRLQEHYQQTVDQKPSRWQRTEVQEHLQALELRIADLQHQQVRFQAAQDIAARLEAARTELAQLDAQCETFGSELNLDPRLTIGAQAHFAHLVESYQRAQQEYLAGETQRKRLEEEIAQVQSRISAYIIRWQAEADPAMEAPALQISLDDLATRLEQAQSAQREMETTWRDITRLDKEIQQLADEEGSVFTEVGLEPGQDQELQHRLDQLPRWRELQKDQIKWQSHETEQRVALEQYPRLVALVEADRRDELEKQREQAAQRASTLEQRQEELTTIQTRLAEAGRDGRLEQALAEVERYRTSLEERYQESQLARTAQLLLDGVEGEYRREHEPAVLRYARQRFQRFTHYHFDIELDDGGDIRARDVQYQASRSLTELSTATRMQLLLAMRLAWAQHLEQGQASLPLFLDEALTTSDEHRFTQVVQSLDQIVQEEQRQLFYLSARRHEVALWKRIAQEPPHHIDLAQLRFATVDDESLELVSVATEPLPTPEGQDAAAYAHTLGLPPVDLYQPLSTLHIFHLLRDDLWLLHHLMENWRIFSLGQLENLLYSSAVDAAISDPRKRQQLQNRCQTARAWMGAWRHGRGRPVNRTVLEDSGCISEKFMDGVAELAQSVDSDGMALIDGLRRGEVPRFRAKNIDELEQWLEENEYIAPQQEPLDVDERQRTVLQQVAAEVPMEELRQVVQWMEEVRPGV